ncbi:MAG: hypothetical protein M3R38_13870 [Actinomycetota bacterium]|nr:hypothetical protein [Actinomycetota bacterium]
MKKTVQQIREEHGRKAAGILSAYHDEIDRVREIRKPEVDPHLSEYLSDEQRMALLRDQKRERANAAHERALDAYSAEMDRYQDELDARATHVKKSLFGMSSPESAAILSRAAVASEEELGTMLELAADADNAEVSRAVLLAAERRGFAGLVARALEHAGEEARELYAEWAEVPPAEVLERQREGVDRIVTPPDYDRLEGTPLPSY